MATELLANNFTTTLAGNGGSITSGATTINVTAAAPSALQGGQFRIVIDGELLIVTAGQTGTAWTVARGAEGTLAASHGDGAIIAHVLTAGSLASVMASGGFAIPFSYQGALAAVTGAARVPVPVAGTIIAVRAAVGTAPTGATIITDVHKNGTTVFTTQANRPTIAISGTSSTTTLPDVTALAAGDLLSVDINQTGSIIPGSDLVVVVYVHPS